MSKISLVDISDNDMASQLVTDLIESFRKITNKFPDAILITQRQGEQWFNDASGIWKNYHGVPIEVEKKVKQTETALKTINAILTGMHIGNIKDVAQVYQLLEAMKEKV